MLLEIIEKIADEIINNKEYLTELDRVIGDGDHGVNLARGFEEIKVQLPTYSSLSYSDIFQKMGMALLTKVGGASGAIYGTAFMSAAMYCKGKTELEKEDLVAILKTMIEGIQKEERQLWEKKPYWILFYLYMTFYKRNWKEGKIFFQLRKKSKKLRKKGWNLQRILLQRKGELLMLEKEV